MKIAFMSDVHLEFYEHMHGFKHEGRRSMYSSFSLPEECEADVFVVAGDIHPHWWVRDGFKRDLEALYGKPVVFVEGNHDYYYDEFPHMKDPEIFKIEDKRFATATLWTRPSPLAAPFKDMMNDFRLIEGVSLFKWEETHEYHARTIFKADPDVVVTHHLPSWQSVPDRFKGDALSQFYATELGDDVLNMKSCRLWIHGHTHDPQDYMLGDVRVVCNPIGYPGQNAPAGTAEWKVVEV